MILKILTLVVLLACLRTCYSSPSLQVRDLPDFYDLRPELETSKIGNNGIQPQKLLPASLNPFSYSIKLRPILYSEPGGSDTEWTAPGFVEIGATAVIRASQIVLHRHPNLRIDNASIEVKDQNQNPIRVTGVDDPDDSDHYGISLAGALMEGENYTVSIKYVAEINQDGTGLGIYRAFHTDEKGEVKRLATTQFMEYGARKVFPCFDEPSFKSKFTISLARDTKLEGYLTLSNSDLSEVGVTDPDLPSGWVYDKYQTTVQMTTYLNAIVIADYTFKEATPGIYNKPVRVYGPPSMIRRNGGDFSADASAKVMKALEELFEEPYPMAKVDSVAIPREYFGPGAMENWGLIIYKDNYLMYFDGESVEANRQQTARVIVHEQVHQWFGNLVTCKYWSHIWLDEGFATYLAALGLPLVYPEFDQTKEFLVASVQKAMAYDVGPQEPVLNLQADLDRITSPSVIIYDKAGSVIRMMEGLMGLDNLQAAMADYLKTFKFTSVTQDDLLQVFSKYVPEGLLPRNKTLKTVMETWTTKPGFPLIHVSKISNDLVYISQERYLPVSKGDTRGSSKARAESLWEVPVPIVTAQSPQFSNHTPTLWLSQDTLMTVYRHNTSAWLVLNPDAFGFYRVLYDKDLLLLIQNQLNTNHEKISGLSRSQLIDDYFSFAKLGHIPITTALEMTKFLEREVDFVVWYTVFNCLQKTLEMFSNENLHHFKAYLAPKLDAALETISWSQGDESGTRVIYRSKLIDWACALESPGCVRTSRELFAQWSVPGAENPVALDLQPALYCSMVAHNEEAFDSFIHKFEETDSKDPQKEKLLKALACSKDLILLTRLLDLSLDSSSEFSPKAPLIFQAVASNSIGRPLVLTYLDFHFDQFKSITSGVVAFSEVVNVLSRYLTTEDELNYLEQLIQKRAEDLIPVQTSLASSMRAIKDNIAWIELHFAVMSDWYQAQSHL